MKGLWSDVIMDAGKVMETKECGATFRRVEMEIDDAGAWMWKIKSEERGEGKRRKVVGG